VPARARSPKDRRKCAPIDWREVDRLAQHGGTVDEIVAVMSIDRHVDIREVQDRLEEAVARGHAKLKLALRRQIERRAVSRRVGGSSNLLALQARNWLGWDRQLMPDQVSLPLEIAGATDRLVEAVKRYQRARPKAVNYNEPGGLNKC
jgi:hypothetical protein